MTDQSQIPETSSSNTSNIVTAKFNLQFLCSLIPKSFDGKRNEFNEFVTNCENAMTLAHEDQKYPLLVFIISKLTGTVRTQLQGKVYDDWANLKEILNSLYQDKKHYIQLMEELNTLKQGFNESVASFHERIDKLVVRLLNTMTYKNSNEKVGKIETIKELALSRFIHHSIPDISRFLRCQTLDDISDALSKATLEERALKISKDEFRSKPTNFCNFCKKNGHISKNCFRKQNNKESRILVNQKSQNNSNHVEKFCRYCKKPGHLIQDCRKREYNNKIKNNQNASSSQNPNEVHLNCSLPQVDAVPVDLDILEA